MPSGVSGYGQFEHVAIRRGSAAKPRFAFTLAYCVGTPIFEIFPVSSPISHLQTAATGRRSFGITDVGQLLAFSFPDRNNRGRFTLAIDKLVVILTIVAFIRNHSPGFGLLLVGQTGDIAQARKQTGFGFNGRQNTEVPENQGYFTRTGR
jgi:hypothetical protein